jgi:AraC family transcriptional regulator of adaptative response/methylated-DNA-[protein]-cysteine methyltransferase
VVRLIETPARAFSLPLDVRGSAFQERVWRALREIPAGQTLSYGELARKLDVPKAARAVARACADNPLAVAIPCHRVVRGDGGLGGYRWGLARKEKLLQREVRAARTRDSR